MQFQDTTWVERLASSIDAKGPDECWPWTGRTLNWGYGYLMIDSRQLRAHRLVLTLASGAPPTGKTFACHRCDNPPCCNPAHLYWGSPADNMRDMALRKRGTVGERNRHAKLTAVQVLSIRKRYAARRTAASMRQTAADYGVGFNCVERIVYRMRWKHL